MYTSFVIRLNNHPRFQEKLYWTGMADAFQFCKSGDHFVVSTLIQHLFDTFDDTIPEPVSVFTPPLFETLPKPK